MTLALLMLIVFGLAVSVTAWLHEQLEQIDAAMSVFDLTDDMKVDD